MYTRCSFGKSLVLLIKLGSLISSMSLTFSRQWSDCVVLIVTPETFQVLENDEWARGIETVPGGHHNECTNDDWQVEACCPPQRVLRAELPRPAEACFSVRITFTG